jgi:hypothetical protein
MAFHSTFWVVDVDGLTLVIESLARKASSDALRAEADEIATSATFLTPANGVSIGPCALQLEDRSGAGAGPAPIRLTLGDAAIGELRGPVPDPFPDLGAVARLDFSGTGWGEHAEHGRPNVWLTAPPGDASGFSTASTVGGFQGSVLVNGPGRWWLVLRAAPDCLRAVPIDVQAPGQI